ncbi:O-antigen ligase family protein [Sphingomonas jatrophae]|uniref:O-antigen ligase n=1 Tax=Sphingomonas jatrophae TaxID=1166337 RepID=A0A1I6L615_9SPHN|nr:O-antigen ligase family protein [Sphingomonas jatrophae]SFR98872.1 O-antigen ligase [Sphingomonas jatrophae]
MSRVISRYLAPTYLLLCLLLGGASAAGYIANGLLQLLGLICILIVVLSGSLPDLPRHARRLLALFGLLALLLLFELIPLPPALWSLLPGRGVAADGYALLDMATPWLPISLSPDGTIAILATLVPPLAMVLLVFASSGYGRLYAVYVLVAVAGGSIFLGVFQRMQGPDSPYYIYEITNRGGVVGMFANRNHLATLLLTALPFVGALAISPKRNKMQVDSKVGRLMITGCLALLLTVGLIIVKSAAGWMLLPAALFAAAAVYVRGEKGAVPRALWQVGVVVGVVCLIAAVVAPLKVNDLGDRLSGIDPHMRNQSIRTTARASLDYLPFGSGGGTFQLVFPNYEDVEAASLEYLNHAHNDYVEVALEHGLPGMALIVLAIAFWVSQGRRLWRKGEGDALAWASFVAVGLVIAHSLVDYPLRTAAIAAVAALGAALMVAPETAEMPSWQSARKRKRRSGSSARTIEIALAD